MTVSLARHRIELLARGNAAKKPSAKSVEVWKGRSPEYRENYLKNHPDSVFKNIRVNTMSERISNDPDNQAVKETAEQSLIDLGFKAKSKVKDAIPHLVDFMKSKDRDKFGKKGVEVAFKVLHRIKGQDRADMQADAKAVLQNARQKPSSILNKRNGKRLIVGLVGMGVCAAILGTALVSPGLVAFVGIKALDHTIQLARNTLAGTSIDEFLIASAVTSFVTGNGGGFFDTLLSKFRKDKSDDEPETEDTQERPDNDNDNESDDPVDTSGGNGDVDRGASNSPTQELPEEESSQEVELKRPSVQKIEALKAVFDSHNVSVAISPRPTNKEQLQRPVAITIESGSPADIAKALRETGLVSAKTMKPFVNFNQSSFTAYLTK